MKPDWDKLMEEYKGHDQIVIADVDCTAGGQSLCDQLGVRGFPTLKYGEPEDLLDYKGGRDYAALEEFAKGLKVQCSPSRLGACDEVQKAEITRMQALTKAERETEIEEKTKGIEKIEADFKELVDALQKKYQEANAKKNQEINEVKEGGLGLLKAVHANEAKKNSEKEDL